MLPYYIEFMMIVHKIIPIYTGIILAYCLASMLVGFGILDVRNNKFLYSVVVTLAKLVEPLLNPIRAILPNTGSLDFAPIILLLLIQYLIPFILNEIFRMIYSLSSF